MIQRLSIKNFKSYDNLENMEFGKMTAVLGPNSSGKTSLIQFLHMKQINKR
ncbi:MAG: AAA family ATPase [Chloroflexi bacterium]|nr:AAA family ATPase [Chloroflexota bacterium]